MSYLQLTYDNNNYIRLKKDKNRMKRSKVFKQVNDHTTQLYDRVTKLETQILDKISNIKKNKTKNSYLCEHLTLEPQCEQYNPKIDYYDLFWKTFLLNQVKRSKIQTFVQQCESLTQSIDWIEKKFSKYERLVSYRNNNNMGINTCYSGSKDGEKYMCKIQGCGKTYQSLGALDLHHKIKHQSDKEDSDQDSIMMHLNNSNGNGSHRNNKGKN